MRKLLLGTVFLCAFSTLGASFSGVAHAQVSDADRAAARDLFFEGVKLQNDGKFPEALDRFGRAQRIFSAPTHLLHIAECQVATGQLVEGSETYRTLVRTPLPQGSPPAFTQAQQQGAAELAQVEPRIPTVKIDVTPQNPANLQVQVDGAPMNTALVGVMRPIDPGQHKIAVYAPGYTRVDAILNIKERESKTVPIQLQQSGGVVYGPAVTPPPVAGANPPPAAGTTPPPAGQPEQPQEWAPQKKTSTMGLLLGARAGVMFPTGTIEKGINGGPDTSMSDKVSTGGALGFEGNLRFARHFMIGLGFEHGFYGKGDNVDTNVGPAGTNVSTTISSNLVDIHVGYISNPDGLGFYGELGLGYRWLIGSTSFGGTDASTVYNGGELSLGAGIFIKAGNSLRIIPKVNFGIGQFSTADTSCSGTLCSGNTTASLSLEQAFHTFIFLGVGGFYNIDLGKN